MCQFHMATLYLRHIEDPPPDFIGLNKQEQAFITCYCQALALLDHLNNRLNLESRLRYAQDYIWLGTAHVALWLFAVSCNPNALTQLSGSIRISNEWITI